MNRIRIPQGMIDLIYTDCEKKKALQTRVEEVFRSYGYREIETPEIEYLETYRNAFGYLEDETLYKFFDQEGKTLALRMDMTVPIARVCASKYANAEPPFRVCYCSDVFKVRHTFAGQRSQNTDCGIELIGCDEAKDLEVLAVAMETMAAFNVREYRLEIGDSEFFRSACKAIGINGESKKLAELIDRKSMVELEEYLDTLAIDEKAREFFKELPLLGGGEEVLDRASNISFTDELKKEVEKLRKLYEGLKVLGYADHVSFDFGKVPHLEYYTGMIFEGYVSEVATSVLSGGRYDNLLAKFGRDLPACGFSIKLDALLDVLEEEEYQTVKICYPKGMETDALLLAKKMRRECIVELVEADVKMIEVRK